MDLASSNHEVSEAQRPEPRLLDPYRQYVLVNQSKPDILNPLGCFTDTV